MAQYDPRAAAALEERPPPPDLFDGAGLYLAAWDALQFDRGYSPVGAPLPIHWTVLRGYFDSLDLPTDDFGPFQRLMQALDRTYCTLVSEKIDRERKDRAADR